jgi:hypothetical protein
MLAIPVYWQPGLVYQSEFVSVFHKRSSYKILLKFVSFKMRFNLGSAL